jgi:hypothetical protein
MIDVLRSLKPGFEAIDALRVPILEQTYWQHCRVGRSRSFFVKSERLEQITHTEGILSHRRHPSGYIS